MANIFKMFDSLPAWFIPQHRPSSGTTYLYKWTDEKLKEAWRNDGYHWRQSGSDPRIQAGNDQYLSSRYFQIYDCHKSWTKRFIRAAYYRDDCPNSVIITYTGDESKAADFNGDDSNSCVLFDIESTTADPLESSHLADQTMAGSSVQPTNVEESMSVPWNRSKGSTRDLYEIYPLFDSLPASYAPLNRPKGATIYLYRWHEDKFKDDWRADGYRWRQSGGHHTLKGCGDKTTMSNIYFQVYDGRNSWTKSFMRTAYTRTDRPNSVVIVYTGDETNAAFFSHGNARHDKRSFVRTLPHVLRDIKSTSGSPQAVYQSMVSDALSVYQPLQSTAVPRNKQQICNVRKALKRPFHRVARDALFSAHKYGYDVVVWFCGRSNDPLLLMRPPAVGWP